MFTTSRFAFLRTRTLSLAARSLSVLIALGVFGISLTGCSGSSKFSGPTGTTVTTKQSGLTISGATGTSELKNGLLARPFTAQKIVGANGQYTAGTDTTRPILSMDLFDLNLVVGETFDPANAGRCNLNAIDGSGAYDADSGTITVTAVSATSLTLSFTNVHFKAAQGSTPPANQFTLNGSVTAPVTVVTQ